jgi:triosephosphate isomerase
MLKEVGAEIAEIGHSERRHVLHETDREENLKVLAALRHGITPLLCIGETAEQKDLGVADETLSLQLKTGLAGVGPEQIPRCMIAYEPVWAIGVSGKPASKEYAEERHRAIKSTLKALYGAAANQTPVLYGGSVNSGNAAELAAAQNIDGLFVGRSAWDAAGFNALIRLALAAWKR